MAITNAQQAKQLLQGKAPKNEFLAYINKGEAKALKRAGGSGHLVNGIPSFVGSDYSTSSNANKSGYQGGMRGKGGYQGSTGETNKTKSIASNASEQLLTEPLILLESEVLKVTASDANELHVVASLLEMNRD